MGTATVSVDEFQALEQKVLQTVELIKKEREARSTAEAARSAAEAARASAEAARNAAESDLSRCAGSDRSARAAARRRLAGTHRGR